MKIRTDKIFYKKLLYKKHFDMWDEWGTDDEKYHYELDFEIYKCFSLSGVSYSVYYSDGFTNQKNLFDAIGTAVDHMLHDSPNYYRLKERLFAKQLWKQLD